MALVQMTHFRRAVEERGAGETSERTPTSKRHEIPSILAQNGCHCDSGHPDPGPGLRRRRRFNSGWPGDSGGGSANPDTNSLANPDTNSLANPNPCAFALADLPPER